MKEFLDLIIFRRQVRTIWKTTGQPAPPYVHQFCPTLWVEIIFRPSVKPGTSVKTARTHKAQADFSKFTLCMNLAFSVVHKFRSVLQPTQRILTAWRHDPMDRPSEHTIPGKLPNTDCWWEQCGKLYFDTHATRRYIYSLRRGKESTVPSVSFK
jgi:hypothetical protein